MHAELSLVEVKKGLTRRSIEQLGFVKHLDLNLLVVLSEGNVTLFPLSTFSQPTPLQKAKAAFSFAVHSSVQDIASDVKSEYSAGDSFAKSKPIPMLVTQLLIGCRRKVVIYSWRDGEAQEPKEAPLPHSARIISFLNDDTVCFAYSPTEYAMFTISTMTAVDISTPLPITSSTSAGAMGALSGLTGYMTLGLGAKPKPASVRISEKEALISKDGQGHAIGEDAKVSRPTPIEWPAPPEELAYIKPYIFSVLPPGCIPIQAAADSSNPNVATQSQPNFIPSSVLQIRSSLSLLTTQTIPFPFTPSDSTSSLSATAGTASNATIRLLTPITTEKAPLYLVTTPTDRTAASTEGSTIWHVKMKSWAEQIDELVQTGQYADALALLETVDEALLPDKEIRRTKIRALNAVSDFRVAKFDAAIDTFIDLDFNPAKVVALYPEQVAGRLSVPQDEWIHLYGGPKPITADDNSMKSTSENADKTEDDAKTESQETPAAAGLLDSLANPVTGSLRGRLGTGLATVNALIRSAPTKEDPSPPPITSTKPKRPVPDDLHRSIEALLRYLSDRRPKLGKALESVGITPKNQSHATSRLSEASVEELFALPNAPLAVLTPEQLLRCAQKLGPEHLQLVFEASRWIFATDQHMAFNIFTSEDVDLPRQDVAIFLASIDPKISARYLEYVIEERNEQSSAFHDRLAELYFSMTVSAKKRGDEREQSDGSCMVILMYILETHHEIYSKLLQFIRSNDIYSVDRLYGTLSSTEDLYEARALLLGRLGRHHQALEIYVYQMQDYLKAEEYCKGVYETGTETKDVFLTLLRIYLRPTVSTNENLLTPALDLISRHNSRLDVVETLQLLPPLVTAQDIRGFLVEALRAPIFDTSVVRHISKARNDQLSRKLMLLQTKRVKVTDSRM
ncbi:hypothetical protein H0H93_009921 [Arthromyces matolae]|nr:hypothetical protein H0H93_009921 [Arthromyces matolae]